MSKNIKISNIDSEKLLNGEMNKYGIKINGDFNDFIPDSYEDTFDCVRADIRVSDTNELRTKSVPYQTPEDLKNNGFPLKVTICKNHKIYEVDPLKILPEYPNVYEERNIDNVFPFNKISLVTKKEITNNVDKTDGVFLPRGYNKANIEFLKRGDSYSAYIDTTKQSFLYRELINDCTNVEHDYNYRNYVKIPRFYLRILFFHSKDTRNSYGDNDYYRRYEIISPETYNKLNNRMKFGFFVPKAFNDNDYLYISNTPEIVKLLIGETGKYNFVSSPFGSEIGCQIENETGYQYDSIYDLSESNDNLMTSDVWFGIVHILFKIYTGYFNPKFLLGEQTDASVDTFDGVHSLITIYEQKLSNEENVLKSDSNSDNYLSFNLENNVFICDGKQGREPINALAVQSTNTSELSGIVRDNKSFLLYKDDLVLQDEVNHWLIRLKLRDITFPIEQNLFVTNLLLWKGGGDHTAGVGGFLVWFDRGFLIRDDLINNGTNRDVSTYFNCKYFMGEVETTSYSNKAYIVKDTDGTYFNQNDIFIEFELYGDFQVTPGTNDEVLQYSLFKEGFDGLKQDIVKKYLLGKSVILKLCPPYSEENDFLLIDAQLTNFNSTNTEIESRRFNIIDNSSSHKGIILAEIDINNIFRTYTYTQQNRKIYVYRHPVNSVAGNIYQNKRYFVDLSNKNQRLNNKFSLLYFNNFISQYEYVQNNQYAYYPQLISDSYNYMPFLDNGVYEDDYGNDTIEPYIRYPQEGVALFDTSISVTRKTYRYHGVTDLFLEKAIISINGTNYTVLNHPSTSGIIWNKNIAHLNSSDFLKMYSDQISLLDASDYFDGKIDGVWCYNKDYYYINLPYSELSTSSNADYIALNISGTGVDLVDYVVDDIDLISYYILSSGSILNYINSTTFEVSLNTLNASSTSTEYHIADGYLIKKASNRRSNYLTLLYHSGN